jgi:Undecaprenyl-phosphate glucose phosphotransferase
VAGHPVRGTLRDLIAFAQTDRLDEIIIALPLRAAERIGEIVDAIRLLPVDIRLGLDAVAGSFPITGIGTTASVPVVKVQERPLKHWNGVIKALEDRLLGSVALIIFSPLMLIIAAVIRLDSRGPILFVQDRFGFNNRPVRVLKFRTMHVDKGDPSGARRTVRNDPRITRIGRLLRASSLDELPQLINVLRGELSLVGPRAHAVAMRAGDRLYHEAVGEYLQRHKVRPGMTGWAQVNGLRGEIAGMESARKRVAYDLHYIEHWSFWLDLKIILMTVRALCSRQNAY